MPVTVLYKERSAARVGAVVDGDQLWLTLPDLSSATGWEIKPQGACLGDRCVPIPAGREAEFLRRGGSELNLAALAELVGQAVAYDSSRNVWVFGEEAEAREQMFLAGRAPDFRLPDMDGRVHALSDYRGKKVLLVTWASW